MVCRYSVILLFLATTAIPAFAGIQGILTGKVTDKDGAPISGATIRVVGTNKGGIAKADGKYTIININAGDYDVRVTAVGYDTTTKHISLSADQTLTVNFALTQGGVLKSDVIVEADREMVRSTDVGTSRVTKGKDMVKIARDNVASVISLNPGVRAEGNNFVIRGSRTTETQVLVDGLTVTDQFTGGLGQVGSTISPAMPSPFATEEVQTQTGGFGAEYGNAVGGVVNTVVKTGRDDRFEGLFRWRKDVPFLWGTAGNGFSAGTPNEDVVDATIGGPLGFNRSTFFLAYRNTYQNNRSLGLEVTDPWGNNLGQLPDNRTFARNLTARLRFQVTNEVALVIGGLYGTLSGERSSHAWLYANDEGYAVDEFGDAILNNGNIQYNGFRERPAKQVAVQEFSNNAFAQINHTIGNSTAYELRASYNRKTTETGRRKGPEAPNLISGFDLWYPEDQWNTDSGYYAGTGGNQILDPYEILRLKSHSNDGYLEMEVSKRNQLTGFVEGPADNLTTANPYGLIYYFDVRGNEGGVDFRQATFWQFDGNLTHNLELGDTRHVFKGGFELRLQKLVRHSNGLPWDGNPFYDVYGSEYGGNLYATSQELKSITQEPFTPITGGLFIQDQIQFKGLVFTPGLRVDYLQPNSMYRPTGQSFIPIDSTSQFQKASSKLYLSPRITITYPVSESGRQNFKLAYGIYYQASPWSDFFDSYNVSNLRGGVVVGNPNLEMQRTNQYEVSYNHQLTDNFAMTITGYYKDIYNQSDVRYVAELPNPYYESVTAAYGNSKGIEITFNKRTVDNWGMMFNYTLSAATGTANQSQTIQGLDPYTGAVAFPVEPFPLSFDRRHRINGGFTLEWGRDEGPTIAGVPFLEYITANLTGFWQSGAPYTPLNGQGQAAGAINSGRFPATWNLDLRLNRTIPLSGLLGGNTAIDVFFDVTNLLNFTGAVSFYPRTGSPDYDGQALNRVPGDFPSTNYYRDADPKNKVTIEPAQYDRVGNRLYSSAADFNNDGVLTPQESYRGYQQYVTDTVNRRFNYQYPRQVYFGIMFRF